jgi:hypothetical protein
MGVALSKVLKFTRAYRLEVVLDLIAGLSTRFAATPRSTRLAPN